MRTVAIIQARMGSTRLSGKVLAEAAGKPLLQHMVERLQRCRKLDDIYVATPGDEAQRPIWDLCKRMPVSYVAYVGDEDDVLSRVLYTAHESEADVIVELTADCPLIDPLIVNEAVQRFGAGQQTTPKLALSTTSRPSINIFNVKYAYPPGMDVRVFTTAVLEKVDRATRNPAVVQDLANREHVSLYIWEHQRQFWCHEVLAPEGLQDDVRLTVDTPEDLHVVRSVFEYFAPRNDFSLGETLEFLTTVRPELRTVNALVTQKEVR